MKVFAYAKLNLTLRVVGRRPDGYHELQSLATAVDLADRITLTSAEHGVELVAPPELGPVERNLALRAARAILPEDGPGVRIALEKRIPAGAGLGGGSSDAAAVLAGVNELFSLGRSPDKLCELGAALGADVPFFLGPSPAWVEGIGDRITPVEIALPSAFLILVPPFRCPTPDVYQAFDELRLPLSSAVEITAEEQGTPGMPPVVLDQTHGSDGSASRDASANSASLRRQFEPQDLAMANDLWPAAVHLFPELRSLWRLLDTVATDGVGMTGSGSALFAPFPSCGAAEAARARFLPGVDGELFVASPIPWGYRIRA